MSPDTATNTGITTGELHRAVGLIRGDLGAISTKLDSKVDKADQIRKDTEQDAAISNVERKIDKVIWAVVSVALTSVGGLFLALVNRGLIQ